MSDAVLCCFNTRKRLREHLTKDGGTVHFKPQLKLYQFLFSFDCLSIKHQYVTQTSVLSDGELTWHCKVGFYCPLSSAHILECGNLGLVGVFDGSRRSGDIGL